MVAAADAPNYAQRLGIQKDQVVQELGWDEDIDDDIRADIEDACGGELLDEDADEVIDVVLLWWRDDDGDLVDRLMDAITPLADDGVIWVVTPKTGKPGHVHARRDRRVGADGGADADLVGQPRRLERQSAGAAEVQGRGGDERLREERARYCSATEAPDFTLKDQNGQPVTLSDFRGAKNVLLVFFPLAFTGDLPGRARRDPRPPAGLRERRHRHVGRSRWDRHPRTRFGPPQSGFTFPVLSDFWPHGAVAQAYGVFNDDAGFANRGTFVVDRAGHHPVRRDEAAGRAARSGGLDRRAGGAAGRADGFPVARCRRVFCPATGA